MPKALTEDQVRRFEEEGYLAPLPLLAPNEAASLYARLEDLERQHPDYIGKLDFKANLVADWIDRLSRDARMLDVMEDLLGPDLLHWNTTFRIKAADGKAHAGWHQDTMYIRIRPIMITAWLALTPATRDSGCVTVIPGSHKWPLLAHAESVDPDSILSRAQNITEDFDTSGAVDLVLAPGEFGLFNHGIVHGSGANVSGGRRVAMLFDYLPASGINDRRRDSAMLVRGRDQHGNFDLEAPPKGAFGPAELAAQERALDIQTQVTYENSRHRPKGLDA